MREARREIRAGAASVVISEIQHQRDHECHDDQRKRTTFQENTPFSNNNVTKRTGSRTRASSKSK